MVQGKQVGENLLGGEVGAPPIGAEHRFVERAVGVFQPGAFAGGAEVVELGEGAGFQVVFGDGRFAGRGLRVEPVVAEADEFAGGVGDGFDARVFGFGRLRSGDPSIKFSAREGR